MIRGLRQELIMVNKLMRTLVWIILAEWVILKGEAAAGERAERGGEKIKIALEYCNVEDAGQTPGSDTLKGLNNFMCWLTFPVESVYSRAKNLQEVYSVRFFPDQGILQYHLNFNALDRNP